MDAPPTDPAAPLDPAPVDEAPPLVAVLAGGRSRRFPGGKLAARLGDGTLLEAVLALARRAGAGRPGAVGLAGAPPPGTPVPPGVPTWPDPRPDRGPLGGLLAASRHAPGGFLALAGDMPGLDPADLRRLWAASEGRAAACFAGGVPLPVALRPAAYPALAALVHGPSRAGPRRLLATLGRGPAGVVAVPPPPPEALRDADTPADLAAIKRRASGTESAPPGS